MGTYATTTALELTMVGVNFSAANMTALSSKAISHAEAEVNKYLSKRYDLSASQFQTATSIPPLVSVMTERLAEGYLWQWLSRGSKESMTRGKVMIDGVLENLRLIADYKLDLTNSTGSAIADMSNTAFRVMCNTTNYTDTFGEDSELAWAPDSDKLDDISNSRD